MKNVAYSLVGNIFISVHGQSPPSEVEFPAILEKFKSLDYRTVRMLVVTEGGGPTPVQRKEMNAVLNGSEMVTAVVSNAMVIRGTVTALGWFNKRIRSFSPTDLNAALAYLEVPKLQIPLITSEVARLQTMVK